MDLCLHLLELMGNTNICSVDLKIRGRESSGQQPFSGLWVFCFVRRCHYKRAMVHVLLGQISHNIYGNHNETALNWGQSRETYDTFTVIIHGNELKVS